VAGADDLLNYIAARPARRRLRLVRRRAAPFHDEDLKSLLLVAGAPPRGASNNLERRAGRIAPRRSA